MDEYKKPTLSQHLRRTLLSGVLFLVPTAATLWGLTYLFNNVDGILGEWLAKLLGKEIPGLGLLATLLLVYVVGLVASNVVGQRLLALWDQFFTRVPMVGGVYRVTKEVSQAFGRDKKPFREVVAIEFPRKGVWSLGFLTAEAPKDNPAGKECVFVFVPTTPNPTSGFLMMVPKEDTRPTPYSVDEGMRLIISMGILGPGHVVDSQRGSTDASGKPQPG